MKKLTTALAVMALLGGCVSQYKPHTNRANGGYEETMLAQDTFQVSFQGNDLTKSSRVRDFAMLRAAELSLQKGFPYFVVLNMGTDTNSYQVPISGGSANSVSYGNYTHTTVNPMVFANARNYRAELTVKGFTAENAPSNALSAQEVMKDIKAKYKIQ